MSISAASELIGGGFVPVGGAVFEGVEDEALGLDGLLPVLAGVGGRGAALFFGSCHFASSAAVAAA